MRKDIVTFFVFFFCLFVNNVHGKSISLANYSTNPGFELVSSQVCNGLSYLRAIVTDTVITKDSCDYKWLFNKTDNISGRWEILDITSDSAYTADEIEEDGKVGYYRVAVDCGEEYFVSNAVFLEPHDCVTPHITWNDFHYMEYACNGPWWCVWYPVNIDTLRISVTEYYDYTIEVLDSASIEGSISEVSSSGISVCYYLPEPMTIKDSVRIVLRSGDYADTTSIYYNFYKEIYGNSSISVCYGDSVQMGDTILKTTGIYTITTTTPAGCDYIQTVDFYVNPPEYDVTNATICMGESYLWNGKYYNKTGIYYDTLQNSKSCDVYCTLNLKVNDVYRDTIYVETCKDDNQKVSGITIDSMLSINGCDSIKITDLKVHPTYFDTTFAIIKQGEKFAFNGKEYKDEGFYEKTYTTTHGCDSVVALNVRVLEPVITSEDVAICEKEHFQWREKDYNASGTYADTVSKPGVADSIFILNLMVNIAYRDSFNIQICKDEEHIVSGITIDSMLSVNGCDSIRITNLKVHPTYFDTTFSTIRQGEKFTFEGKDYYKEGFYKKSYITIHGCDSIIALNLNVESVDIIPMSYFTPNGDEVNDVWIIKNIDLFPDAKVTIFDRFGKCIAIFPCYDNQVNAWDGTYNGNKMPSTDYWYIIDIESIDKVYSGHFTLVR